MGLYLDNHVSESIHAYNIRTTEGLDPVVHAWGWGWDGPKGPCMGWGWDLRSRFVLFFFKNDTLFSLQSRTEDLTHNVLD